MSDVKRFKLGKPYDNFTGLLNNVYPVIEGVVTIGVDKRDPKVLIEHYGAKRIVSKEEAEAAAKSAAEALAALKEEEARQAAADQAAAKAKATEDAAVAAAAKKT